MEVKGGEGRVGQGGGLPEDFERAEDVEIGVRRWPSLLSATHRIAGGFPEGVEVRTGWWWGVAVGGGGGGDGGMLDDSSESEYSVEGGGGGGGGDARARGGGRRSGKREYAGYVQGGRQAGHQKRYRGRSKGYDTMLRGRWKRAVGRGGGDPQIGTRRSGGAVVGGLTKDGRVRG